MWLAMFTGLYQIYCGAGMTAEVPSVCPDAQNAVGSIICKSPTTMLDIPLFWGKLTTSRDDQFEMITNSSMQNFYHKHTMVVRKVHFIHQVRAVWSTFEKLGMIWSVWGKFYLPRRLRFPVKWQRSLLQNKIAQSQYPLWSLAFHLPTSVSARSNYTVEITCIPFPVILQQFLRRLSLVLWWIALSLQWQKLTLHNLRSSN